MHLFECLASLVKWANVYNVWRLNEVINFEQPLGDVITRPEARFGGGLYIASLRSALEKCVLLASRLALEL